MSVEAMAAVLHHSAAKGTDKLVLLGIANHDGDGGAWPSIETLGRYGSCSRTRVKTAIGRLVELGEIAVDRQAGGHQDTRPDRRPNRYRVLLTCPPDCDGTTAHRTNGGHTGDPRDGGHFPAPRGSLSGSTGVTLVTPNRPSEPPTSEPPEEPARDLAQPAMLRPVDEAWDYTIDREGDEPPVLDDPIPPSTFDDFWAVYPRKAGKDAARKAWAKAVSRAAPADIVVAAARFRDDPNREEQFTAHPATWLNQGRWDDDPLPPRHGDRRPSATAAYMDLAHELEQPTVPALGAAP